MSTFDRTYYDTWYDAGLVLKASAHHAVLYQSVLSRVPPDARAILDAGCGDGAVLDRLPRRDLTVGIDFSLAGLRRVHAPAACASIDAMCFADHAFDLVIATEVLEHLPQHTLARAVREIARVARRHIIISVPNREPLRHARRTCPACGSSLHAHGHVQCFDPDRLATLIPGFHMHEVAEVGPPRVVLPDWIVGLKRVLTGELAWPPGRTCPICGYVADARTAPDVPRRLPAWRRAVSTVATKRPTWLVATYTNAAHTASTSPHPGASPVPRTPSPPPPAPPPRSA